MAVYLLGMLTFPTIDLLGYALLRVTGVYYPYWSQGSCDEIDGTCHVYLIDVATLPMRELEVELDSKLHYIRPPSGG